MRCTPRRRVRARGFVDAGTEIALLLLTRGRLRGTGHFVSRTLRRAAAFARPKLVPARLFAPRFVAARFIATPVVALTALATPSVAIALPFDMSVAAALGLGRIDRRALPREALCVGRLGPGEFAVTLARTALAVLALALLGLTFVVSASRAAVVGAGAMALALLDLARLRGRRGFAAELRLLERGPSARLETAGAFALSEFFPPGLVATWPGIRPAVFRPYRVAASVLTASRAGSRAGSALIGSAAAAAVRPTAPLAAATSAAAPSLAATIAATMLSAAMRSAAMLGNAGMTAICLTSVVAVIFLARFIPVVSGLEHLQELRRYVLAQEQCLAVVEVVAFLPRVERENSQHRVVASGAATGLARVVDVQREVQEAPATATQPVPRRAIGVAGVDADIQEFGRLRRFAGFDLDRMAVERAHPAVAQLIARTIAGDDRFLEVALVDRFAEALVERAHDVGDRPETVTVELQAETVRLVPEHVRQRASDALDQRGMGHEEPCKAQKRWVVAKEMTRASSAFERPSARLPGTARVLCNARAMARLRSFVAATSNVRQRRSRVWECMRLEADGGDFASELAPTSREAVCGWNCGGF